jgi:hypothetical protein
MHQQVSVGRQEIRIKCHGMSGTKAWCSNVGLTSGEVAFLELMQKFCGFDAFDNSNVLKIGA